MVGLNVSYLAGLYDPSWKIKFVVAVTRGTRQSPTSFRVVHKRPQRTAESVIALSSRVEWFGSKFGSIIVSANAGITIRSTELCIWGHASPTET